MKGNEVILSSQLKTIRFITITDNLFNTPTTQELTVSETLYQASRMIHDGEQCLKQYDKLFKDPTYSTESVLKIYEEELFALNKIEVGKKIIEYINGMQGV